MKHDLSFLSVEQKQALADVRRAEEQDSIKLWSDVMTLAECGHTYSSLEKVVIKDVLYYACGACRVEREIIEQRVFMAAKSSRDEARLRNEVYRTHANIPEDNVNLCKARFSCVCEKLKQNCKWCEKGRYKKCICDTASFVNVTADYFLIVKVHGGHKVIDHVIYLREKREHVYFQGSFPACSRFVDRMVAAYA